MSSVFFVFFDMKTKRKIQDYRGYKTETTGGVTVLMAEYTVSLHMVIKGFPKTLVAEIE